MTSATALIIDDEPDIRELVALTLHRMGIDCHVAANLEEARNLLSKFEFSICLTDMKLPDGNGVEFVRYIHSVRPDLPVAVITAHGNMEAAVEAMKNGAYDFVSKPVDITLLRKLVSTAVANSQPTIEYRHDNSDSAQVREDSTSTLIGKSAAIQTLRQMIIKLAKTNAPVWITGESGTGKELIAQLIHTNSARSDKPFIPINCGAIPNELMESEFFGHKKGSFTGAVTDTEGLFLQADGGTLFLDEVAELPLHMQVKLLRAIQEKSIKAVGNSKETPVDVRILSASHKDLAKEVEQNRFRHDLYYRLNVIKLESPPLAGRPQDIPELSMHILQSICAKNSLENITITAGAMMKLQSHTFKGNVRELENILERAVALKEGSNIEVNDLALSDSLSEIQNATSELSVHFSTENNITSVIPEENERTRIVDALNRTRWNRRAAAQILDLSYRQLRYRIQQYGIDSNTK